MKMISNIQGITEADPGAVKRGGRESKFLDAAPKNNKNRPKKGGPRPIRPPPLDPPLNKMVCTSFNICRTYCNGTCMCCHSLYLICLHNTWICFFKVQHNLKVSNKANEQVYVTIKLSQVYLGEKGRKFLVHLISLRWQRLWETGFRPKPSFTATLSQVLQVIL